MYALQINNGNLRVSNQLDIGSLVQSTNNWTTNHTYSYKINSYNNVLFLIWAQRLKKKFIFVLSLK